MKSVPAPIVALREQIARLSQIVRWESSAFISGIIRREAIELELHDPDRPLRVMEPARREYLEGQLAHIAAARIRQEERMADGEGRLRPMLARLESLEEAWRRE